MSQPGNWSVPLVGPANGTTMATRINDSLNALMTMHRGSSRPAYLTSGKWLKDVSGTVIEEYFYDGTSDILCGTYDLLTETYTPTGISLSGVFQVANNLSEITNQEEARQNLGVYSIDEVNALSGGVETVVGGETWTAPCAVYLDNNNSRGGGYNRWYKIDANAVAPVSIGKIRGIAVTSCSEIDATAMVRTGSGVVSGFTNLVAGGLIYASSTPGALTQMAPAIPVSGSQNASVIMGRALSTTTMQFEPWHDIIFQARHSAIEAGSSIVIKHLVDSDARERVASAYVAGQAGYGTNLLSSATVTALGTLITGTAASVKDGNTAGYLQWSGSSFSGKEIRFDHGSTIKPAKLRQYVDAAYGCVAGWQLYGCNNADYTTGRTLIADSATAGDFANTTGWQEKTFTPPSTGYRYTIVVPTSAVNSSNPTNQPIICELQMMEAAAARDEPVLIGSENINGGATNMVTVKFSDAADGNQDTNTTFYNRTGATRDLIVEVSL